MKTPVFLIAAISVVCVGVLVLILLLFNKKLPKVFCTKLGWHLEPKEIVLNGCNLTGICPRCGETVLQDSQGNWF